MTDFTIYTYGGGDVVAQVFDGIAMIFKSESETFTPVIRLSLLIGAFWAGIRGIFGVNIGIFAKDWFVPSFLILSLFLAPKSKVNIHDISGYVTQRDNIPYGVALVSSVASKIGYEVTKMIEDKFKPVNENSAYSYSVTGPLFGAKVLASMKHIRISESTFRENVKEMMNRCYTWPYVITDIQGKREEALKSQDLMGFLVNNPHPGLGMYWREGGQSQFKSCRVAAQAVKDKLKAETQSKGILAQFKGLLGVSAFTGENSLESKVKMDALLKINSQNAWARITQDSRGFHEAAGQHMLMNAFKEGYDDMRDKHGHQRLYPELINLQAGRSMMQQNAGWLVGGAAIAEYLPLAHSVLFMILIVSIVLVIPLSFMPGGYQLLGTWVKMIIWVQSWPVFFGIVTCISAKILESQTDLLTEGGGGFNLVTQDGMADVAFNLYCITQGFLISVPLLSWALINKGGYALVNMMERLSPASLGSSMGASMVDNTTSYDNVTVGNRSFANTQMAQQTVGAMTQAGSLFDDGRYQNWASTGNMATIHEKQTNLLTNASYNFANDNMFSEQKGKTHSTIQTLQKELSSAESSLEQSSSDVSSYLSTGEIVSSSVSNSQNYQETQSSGQKLSDGTSVSERDGTSSSRAFSGGVTASASVQAGGGLGKIAEAVTGFEARASASGSFNANADKSTGTSRENSSRIESDSNQTHSKFNQNMKTEDLKATTDRGQKALDSMRIASDKVSSLRKNLSDQEQLMNRYEKLESFQVKEGNTISQNINRGILQNIADRDFGGDLGRASKWQTDNQQAYAKEAHSYMSSYRNSLIDLANNTSMDINEEKFKEVTQQFIEGTFSHKPRAIEGAEAFKERAQETLHEKSDSLTRKFSEASENISEKIRNEGESVGLSHERLREKHEGKQDAWILSRMLDGKMDEDD